MTSVFVPLWSRVGILHIGHLTDPPEKLTEPILVVISLVIIDFH